MSAEPDSVDEKNHATFTAESPKEVIEAFEWIRARPGYSAFVELPMPKPRGPGEWTKARARYAAIRAEVETATGVQPHQVGSFGLAWWFGPWPK